MHIFATSPALAAHTTIRHGFFTRNGGVSGGLYQSLNVGYGSSDDRSSVRQNRARCAEALGLPETPLVTVRQTHSPDVVTVTAPFDPLAALEADALVTTQKNIILGVMTADCAPVLFYDPAAGVIGAAHAGWKGALGGVLECTIGAMLRLGATAERIVAVIGPCIRQPSYEVDSVFYQTFLSEAAAYQTFFAATDNPLKFQFDLAGFVRFRLYNAGIVQVDDLERDTVAEEEQFFSFRRATQRGEADYGRALSAIALL
jgi:YfiH family protein